MVEFLLFYWNALGTDKASSEAKLVSVLARIRQQQFARTFERESKPYALLVTAIKARSRFKGRCERGRKRHGRIKNRIVGVEHPSSAA
jgi:hypothetical protein